MDILCLNTVAGLRAQLLDLGTLTAKHNHTLTLSMQFPQGLGCIGLEGSGASSPSAGVPSDFLITPDHVRSTISASSAHKEPYHYLQ